METYAVALVGEEDRGWLVEAASAEEAIDLVHGTVPRAREVWRGARPSRASAGVRRRPPCRLRFPHRAGGEACVGAGADPVRIPSGSRPEPVRSPILVDPTPGSGPEASTVPKSLKACVLSRTKRTVRASGTVYCHKGAASCRQR